MIELIDSKTIFNSVGTKSVNLKDEFLFFGVADFIAWSRRENRQASEDKDNRGPICG